MSLKKKIYITLITNGIIALVIFFGFFILFIYMGDLRTVLLMCNSMVLLTGIVDFIGHRFKK